MSNRGFLNGGVMQWDINSIGSDWNSETISSGAITVQDTMTEVTSGSATDTLHTINGTVKGDLVVLRAASGKTITVESGTGNIELPNGDVVLSPLEQLWLEDDGTDLRPSKVSGVGGGGDPALGDHRNTPDDAIVALSPDYPPSAMDDEFDDGSTNLTLWDVRDPETNLTYYEGRYGIVMTRLACSAYWAGLYQALPAGDFTIWTKVGFTAQRRTSEPQRGAGFIITPDPTDNQCHVVYVSNSANSDFRELDSSGNVLVPSVPLFGTGISPYLRIRRNGVNWWFEGSLDGISWETDNSFATAQQTDTTLDNPTHIGIGLFCDNDETALDMQAIFRFFRYVPYDVGLLHVLNDVL